MNWISVDDRLPKMKQPVIAYIADRQSVIVCVWVGDFSLARCDSEKGFLDHGVTHWMPLPDPPELKKPPKAGA